jgi:hypothetical protein
MHCLQPVPPVHLHTSTDLLLHLLPSSSHPPPPPTPQPPPPAAPQLQTPRTATTCSTSPTVPPVTTAIAAASQNGSLCICTCIGIGTSFSVSISISISTYRCNNCNKLHAGSSSTSIISGSSQKLHSQLRITECERHDMRTPVWSPSRPLETYGHPWPTTATCRLHTTRVAPYRLPLRDQPLNAMPSTWRT